MHAPSRARRGSSRASQASQRSRPPGAGDRVILQARTLDEAGHGVGQAERSAGASAHGVGSDAGASMSPSETRPDMDVRVGAGKAMGVHLHAADLLPGERAEVEIEHASPHKPHAWGRVVRRLGPLAPERTAPLCPAFGRCGGCAWQHLAYPAQLVHKRERLVQALAAAGVDAEVLPAIAAPAIDGYRNVGKYVAGRAADGSLYLGAYEPRTHTVADTAGCRVVEPAIDRVRAAACAALAELPVFDERTRQGALRYVVMRSGADSRVLAAIVTSSQAARPAVEAAARRLAAHPDVRGVVWLRNDRESATILAGDIEHLAGEPVVTERVAGVDISLAITDFFQVNREQAMRLYALAARLAGPFERAVELYCGVGGIAFALAAAHPAGSVLGIERNPGAVAAANKAAQAAGLAKRLRFAAGHASDMPALMTAVYGAADMPGAAGATAPSAAIDLVVVDPPRKGLDADTRAALAALGPARLVYVSCGPESLARDLAELTARAGYVIHSVQPIDLMPGTAEIESITVLAR